MIHAILAVILLFVGTFVLEAQSDAAPIDFEKARQLNQRRQRGDVLSQEERSYLERAMAERRKQIDATRAPNQRKAPDRLVPLTDLSGEERYEGQNGGLYGGGGNQPPSTHRKKAEAEISKIRPLNSDGEEDEGNGTVGFVALSMSNATQEFSRFKQVADRSALKCPRVTIVDCAQGGQAMAEWAPPDAPPWQEALRRLQSARVSPKQVQVAWVKLANKVPVGSFEEHTRKLERDTLALLQNAKKRFPNLRLVYLGSRTYGGYAVGPLNPEPYAYESAFAARSLIQRQIKGDPELAPDRAPLLLWGPYLWAEGTRGRKVDSLVWERGDFVGDGVHPSDSGRRKVAELMLTFFTADPLAKPWFVKP